MYRLMVSFNKDDFKGVCLVKPKEYLLVDEKEVCKVYLSLDAKRARKSVFGRVVSCPVAFDIVAFSNQMKAFLVFV